MSISLVYCFISSVLKVKKKEGARSPLYGYAVGCTQIPAVPAVGTEATICVAAFLPEVAVEKSVQLNAEQ